MKICGQFVIICVLYLTLIPANYQKIIKNNLQNLCESVGKP